MCKKKMFARNRNLIELCVDPSLNWDVAKYVLCPFCTDFRELAGAAQFSKIGALCFKQGLDVLEQEDCVLEQKLSVL